VFTDGVDVGVMRAAIRYERGAPVGLVRLDARLDPRTVATVSTAPITHWEHAVDVWDGPPPAFAVDAGDWVVAGLVRHLQTKGARLLGELLDRVLAEQEVGGFVWCEFTEPLRDPPKAKGRPRVPVFMKHDPDWREKAKALIAGRKRGRYWSVLRREAGGISQHTANKMIETYEIEQRA
jgi:hypothetical protein